MTWSEYHSLSEQLASQAETVARRGGLRDAADLYRQAAQAELNALEAIAPERPKTLGVTAVSAVALWYKAGDYASAERIAHKYLGADLPQFAVQHLRDLLQVIWTADAAARAGIRFVPGDVLVSVKGGQVVYGGAPLHLIVRKVEEVQAVFYRTAEMLLGLPLRKRGGPTMEIQSVFTPWLFQAPAGSYQFAVRVQEPLQTDLFPNARPQVEQVAAKFLSIVRASATDPEASLAEIVPDPDYRVAFLKLARNLAPTGKAFEQLDIRDASVPAARSISFATGSRDGINAALRKERPVTPREVKGTLRSLHGILRAVHLDRDWIELALLDPPQGEHVTVHDAGDALDDVIGPMVNRPVVVTVEVGPRGRYSFRDIESDE